MHAILKISLEKVKSNWIVLNKASQGNAAAVIKANAYGLGMVEVAKVLINAGCKYFYVASLEEGKELRKYIPSKNIKIAIFEGFLKGYEKIYLSDNLTPIINNLEQLERINKTSLQGKKLKAILNIDTGMNRLGMSAKEVEFLKKNKEILFITKWDFIMSHLANANNFRDKNNDIQLKNLLEFSKFLPNVKLTLANTAGIVLGSKFCLDQTRPGIGLYGIDQQGFNIKLLDKILDLPIKLLAPILQIKNVDINQSISYGGIDKTNRKSKLATIGLGYADGWIRLLKPNSYFSINNYECKILGNITMDSFVLDITNVKNKSINEGDLFCLLDNSNIKNIFKNTDIISYELLTLIGTRVRRQYN